MGSLPSISINPQPLSGLAQSASETVRCPSNGVSVSDTLLLVYLVYLVYNSFWGAIIIVLLESGTLAFKLQHAACDGESWWVCDVHFLVDSCLPIVTPAIPMRHTLQQKIISIPSSISTPTHSFRIRPSIASVDFLGGLDGSPRSAAEWPLESAYSAVHWISLIHLDNFWVILIRSFVIVRADQRSQLHRRFRRVFRPYDEKAAGGPDKDGELRRTTENPIVATIFIHQNRSKPDPKFEFNRL